MKLLHLVILFLASLVLISSKAEVNTPIVYLYTMNHEVCNNDKTVNRWNVFPKYIKDTLVQAIHTQQSKSLIFLSNFKECNLVQKFIIHDIEEKYKGQIKFVDTSDIMSQRTKHFLNISSNIFMNTHGNLWVAASARFFWLQDLMEFYNYSELIHLEADNLLYSPLSSLLPSLRKHYGGSNSNGTIAVTPMNANKSGFTASILWISSISAIKHFNQYFIHIASANHTLWYDYLTWLRPYACCKMNSGVGEDASGKGLKPMKINEMSIMAYYRRLYGKNYLQLFPILPPKYPYYKNKYTCNQSHYAPLSEETNSSLYPIHLLDISKQDKNKDTVVGSKSWEDRVAIPDETGSLFDSGSWGQYLGGTSSKGGRNKKFSESSHIIGQAIGINQCIAQMRCGNVEGIHYIPSAEGSGSGSKKCFMATFLRCGSEKELNGTLLTPWYPLLNLHVHSKKISEFTIMSNECKC